jgi:hypothetical protein
MKAMGHRDVKTAMHYQHPELEVVRAALDYRASTDTNETKGPTERPFAAHSRAHPKTITLVSC